ncbi:hypothetical protein MMC07_009612, partial [Pseudocyphellaria aurata]|nr:hypothetical protein [Pseudocyphellaria aurata]
MASSDSFFKKDIKKITKITRKVFRWKSKRTDPQTPTEAISRAQPSAVPDADLAGHDAEETRLNHTTTPGANSDGQSGTQPIQNQTAPVAHVFAVPGANPIVQEGGQPAKNNTVPAAHDAGAPETSLVANSAEQTTANHRPPVAYNVVAPGADSAGRDQAQQTPGHATPVPQAAAAAPAAAAPHGTAAPQIGSAGHDGGQTTPSGLVAAAAPSSANAWSKSCWDKAFEALKESNREVYDDLQAIKDYKEATPDDVAESAEDKVKQLGGSPKSDADLQKWYTRRNLLKSVSRGMATMKDVIMPLAKLDPHGLTPVALGIAFGGIFALVQVTANDNEQYLFCLSAIVELRPMIARWIHYEARFMAHKEADVDDEVYADLERALIKLYQAILTFLAVMARYCAGSFIKRFAKALIPDLKDWNQQLGQITKKDSNCKSYGEILSGETSFLKDQKAILVWFSSDNPKVAHKKVLDKTKIHNQYQAAGQWVFETHAYQQWNKNAQKDDVSGVSATPVCLWLDGNIGTGKTTVMARVIQTAIDFPVPETVFSFYYFSKTDQEASSLTPVAFLRCLIRQLSWDAKTKALSAFSDETYKELKDERPNSSDLEQSECLELLSKLIGGKKCRIFIDGLDECTKPDDLLIALGYLQDKAHETPGSQLQFLISSRPHVNVERHFRSRQGYNTVIARLQMDRRDQHRQDSEGEEQRGHTEYEPDPDMAIFVVTEIEQKRRDMGGLPLFTASPLLVSRLIHILLERAGTMFRWVELQIELFTNQGKYSQSRQTIREKLDRLEKMDTRSGLPDLNILTEAYQEVYDLVKDPTARWRASLVYKMLLCAFADLSMEDLVEAIKSVTKQEDADEINSVYINEICSCFLTGDDTVHFAHASAQEFLEDLKDKHEDNAPLYAPEKRHVAAAFLCLKTIKQRGTWPTANDPTFLHARPPMDGFLWYSCYYWPFHCREIPPSIRRESPRSQDFKSISQYIADFESISQYIADFESISRYIADFMISSSFENWGKLIEFYGDEIPLNFIRSKGSLIDPRDVLFQGVRPSCGRPAQISPGLLIAVFDFYEVMDILTSMTPKQLIVPTDKNSMGETMPVIACEFGSHGTLRKLKHLFPDDFKKLCTKPETVGGHFVDCFLHRAVQSGSVETVSLLLDNGADVSDYVYSAQPEYFFGDSIRSLIVTGTTLHRAVSRNSADILDTLLKHAQKHLSEEELRKLLLTMDVDGRSALYLAIEKTELTEQRSDAVADLLLKYASSIGSLRPMLLVGFRDAGSALNLCAENFRFQHLDSVSKMLLVLLKHTSELSVEAKQELVSAVNWKEKTARDIAADYLREDQVAILDEEMAKIYGSTVVWNRDIASGEDARGSSDDEEWHYLWTMEQS